MVKTEKYNYDIECLNKWDYRVTITLTASNRMLKYILDKSLIDLRKKLKNDKLNSEDMLEKTKKFDIPDKYINLIKINTETLFKEVSRIALKDGIVFTSGELKDTQFTREGEKWLITLTYKGLYINKNVIN